MNKADLEFIHEMVDQLDRSIAELTQKESIIKAKVGDERIEELTEYWQMLLDEDEAEELKTTFDHWDRMLISTWAHLRRVHDTRAKAGQAVMKNK